MCSAVLRRLLVAWLCGTVVAVAPAASAADPVTVTFSATYGSAPVTHGVGKVVAACPVSVAAGADGVAVLDAAVAVGCIDSYATQTFEGFGRFLSCVDGVCGGADALAVACWFWGMHLNGAPTDYGVDGFRAAEGDVLTFAFQPFGPAALGWC